MQGEMSACLFLWVREPLKGPGHALWIKFGFGTQRIWIDVCVEERDRQSVKTRGINATGMYEQMNVLMGSFTTLVYLVGSEGVPTPLK